MGKNEDRGLFLVHAIGKDDDSIVFRQELVAESERDAMYESDLKKVLEEKGLTKRDVDIVVSEINSLPAREEVKTVRIIGKAGKVILGKEE